MRLTSLFVLGLAALAPSVSALRTSASSTLARLSERLAAAESALAELRAQSTFQQSLAITASASGPAALSQYLFDQSYVDAVNTANKGTILPGGANNIGFVYDNSRAGYTVVRSSSKTYTTSSLVLPTQLPSQFGVSFWINWSGAGSGEKHILDSSDSAFQVFQDASGYLTVVVNGVSLKDSAALPSLQWHFIGVSVDASSFTFWSGTKSVNTKVGTAAISPYPGTAPTLRLFNYGITPDASKQWFGNVDTLNVFSSALTDDDISGLYYGSGATPTGLAPINQNSFYGNFDASQVEFASRVAGTQTGEVRITIQVSDIDVAYGDEIRVRLYGCSGISSTSYQTLEGGHLASYNKDQATVSIFPAARSPTVIRTNPITGKQYTLAISQGDLITFTLPVDKFTITNPTTIYATASDPMWKLGIIFSSKQIPQTGIRWVGILQTPATLSP